MKDFTHHFPHYFNLLGILFLSFTGFILFSYDPRFQLAILAAMCLSYFSWGLVHHFLHRDLSIQIVIEYAVIAFLGFVVGASILYRT